MRHFFIFLIVATISVSCVGIGAFSADGTSRHGQEFDAKMLEYGIPEGNKLSAAMQRAFEWPNRDNSWFIEYKTMPLKGDLAYEEGVVRRDPSSVIMEDSLYYTWYSKSVGKTDGFGGDVEYDKVSPCDRCDIWYATSKDGTTWCEEGVAVERGAAGEYDERSVFTAEIMEWDGTYYLCYQCVRSPYEMRVKSTIGMAWASSPRGPWHKSKEPVLLTSDTGEWLGDEQDCLAVKSKGDFDSHKVQDPSIIPYKGSFYMYYEGERVGEQITWGGRDTKHGVAIADNPLGPYVKSEYNPITNSGHEVCIWRYNGGVASLVTTDGVEKNTIQWSKDGINFEIMSVIAGAPHAIGLNRTIDVESSPVEILKWGLANEYNNKDYQSIVRFEAWNKTSHVAKGEAIESKE